MGRFDNCPLLLQVLSTPHARGHRNLTFLKATNPTCDSLKWKAGEGRGREAEGAQMDGNGDGGCH